MTSKYKIKLTQITEIQHSTDDNTSNYDSALNYYITFNLKNSMK